ncbi:SMP-30/gluconolactonase/LRE family protein [Rhizobium lusitanum]|uniref:SMP-30/gluconolactonase/LRE family protein n=1 Tax=Rhizobium lusitanum TaxID=293958 RepID=A0A6L9UEK4_9HYPH|nr:SMP-30/gluconolactonase/LRE family protein [Rhizobium lusitanum]
MIDAEPLFEIATELGEGPLWVADQRMFYCIDVTGRTIWRRDIDARQTTSFRLAGMPGSIAHRSQGGLLAALRNSLALLDFDLETETKLPVPVDFGKERFNDGKCDRRGRFFVGTIDRATTAPVGGLYRLDADLTMTRVAGDICLSNGIAWSPDDRTLYHCESRPGYVYAYDYDIDEGTVSNRRIHIDLTSGKASPDGCTVDAEGCLWIAECGAGAIGRYDPKGKRIGGIDVPVGRPTSVMFGGDDLATLYITSMRYDLSPEEIAAQPLAGCVLAARPGVRGLPETAFQG